MRIYLAIGGVLAAVLVAVCLFFLWPRPAPAPAAAVATTEQAPAAAAAEAGEFRVCNQVPNRVSIAFGYKTDKGWQSEGWWVAEPNACVSVYRGDLASRRYYYVYAADDIGGGAWDGSVYMCTRDESFTIFGVEDCLARGYERTGFFEVDTKNSSNWTLQLTEGAVSGSEDPGSLDTTTPLEPDAPLGDEGGASDATEGAPTDEGTETQ